MRIALLLLLAVGMTVVAVPMTASAHLSHHYGCASDAVGCATDCADHLVADVTGGGIFQGCLVHP